MQTSIHTLIESRISANYYDTDRPVSDAQVETLARLATSAPSAYNAQNWKLIAVRSPAAKARLQDIAFGQSKVVDAPVTFIVCGTLAAHEQVLQALQPSVDAGIMNPPTVDAWARMARQSLHDNPQSQRDEAFRSASLAAMTLMLAAEGMGLSTGAMSGFDPVALAQEFALNTSEVPVMLVTVGYAAPGNWPQKPRKPLEQVLSHA